MIFNIGGAENVKGKLPEFSFTGQYELIPGEKEGATQHWQLNLLSSGKLTFTKVIKALDLFVLGAGGAGANTGGTAAGGGGYYQTQKAVSVQKGASYDIVIGTGGDEANEGGGASSAFGCSADGGGAATAGTVNYYKSCKVQSPDGTAGNVYYYSSLSADRTIVGSGVQTVDLKGPSETGTHTGGFMVYKGAQGGWYRCTVNSWGTAIYNAGTAGTGAAKTQVFGDGDEVSGPGATDNATRLGQGGGTSGIKGGNGLVALRDAR